ETVPFAGQDDWDAQVAKRNAALPARTRELVEESPLDTTRHMIDRLRAGTAKR
ncbi:MAG: phytanoyl-CoA dioxygenase family protein, partial [Streptomyces sp.]|nr:phytanoyl-CoA dioxygenase family protein [Streptomyces sp.]